LKPVGRGVFILLNQETHGIQTNYQEPTKLLQDCPDFSFQNQPENGLANHAQVKTLNFKGKPCVGTILMKANKS